MLTHSNPAPHPTPHLDSTPYASPLPQVTLEVEIDAVPFGSVRLTEKELDASRDEPARLLEVCLRVAERLMRERSGTSPMDKYRLRSVRLDGEEVHAPICTPAREHLTRSGRRLSLDFYPAEADEAALLRRYTMHVPRLREAAILCFSPSQAEPAPSPPPSPSP